MHFSNFIFPQQHARIFTNSILRWILRSSDIILKNILFIYVFIFREREGKRNINVWLHLTSLQLGTWPSSQACALTGNWTGDSLVHRPALNPLSHTSQHSIHWATPARARYKFWPISSSLLESQAVMFLVYLTAGVGHITNTHSTMK